MNRDQISKKEDVLSEGMFHPERSEGPLPQSHSLVVYRTLQMKKSRTQNFKETRYYPGKLGPQSTTE